MKTVGSILKEAREVKKLTFDEVERDTKIRAKFLEALEGDDYTKLPSLSYAKGFVKNYSDYLGLNSDNVLAFFRRQTKEIPKSSLIPRGVAEPLNRSLVRLTPGRFLALVLIGLTAIFLSYLGLQYRKLSQPPVLLVEAPQDKLVTHERRIDVLGETDSDATITVNGISVSVRRDGKFFDQVTLEPGVNQVTIVATSRFGKSTAVKLELVHQP